MEITKMNHLKDDLNRLYFCIKPLSKPKKKLRIHVTHLLIKDNIATGSDGRRMHKAKLTNHYDDGLYQIMKATKSRIVITKTDISVDEYPATEDIFKATDHFEGERLSFGAKKIFTSCGRIIHKLPGEYVVSLHFLRDLDDSFTVRIPKRGAPILFENANKSAAIMPIAIN